MKIKQGKSPCPCGSGESLEKCCGQYIYTATKAPTAEALMRSRFTANVKKAYKYMADTWYPKNRPSHLGVGRTNWLRLEVLSSQEESPRAWVEFKAYYGHGNHQHALHEKSFFLFEDNQWWYVDGDVLSQDHCGH